MSLDKSVLKFFRDKTGIASLELSSNIAANKYQIFDLDAEYLMENFFKEFQINHSGFLIDDYFSYPDTNWKEIIFLKPFFKKKPTDTRHELLISHLIEVARRKEWFEPK